MNERIADFNTTGLSLRCSNSKGKAYLSFGRAARMSNGERDVLSFVASLLVFESKLSEKPSILIIDEVFDYLDGANLLAVQYYLSKIIESVNESGNVIFPIIMTHLDPQVFKSYCLKRMAIHYLENRSSIDLNDKVVQLLFLRSALRQKNDKDCESLERNMLHYNPNNWIIPKDLLSYLPEGFWADSQSFKDYLKEEIEKYISGKDFNALAVVIALRNKIEEKTVKLLPDEKKEDYYNKHGADKKLAYVEYCGCDLPELFYLVQPLCNDSAHLTNGKDIENKNKMESVYMMLCSKQIQEMIRKIYEL